MKMNDFNYSGPAELYIANRRRAGRNSMTYRKFETAAKAIRYLIEELPNTSLPGTILEVDEERYRHKEIRKLYNSSAYPLPRQTTEVSDATQAQL
ncbi:MAG: hypothetical protein Q8P46_00540 [Hyphomicrobiales bacterium]|nr:hypothetical protein [Hyphomicrobiales bacterium]